jgi:magnesium transporter
MIGRLIQPEVVELVEKREFALLRELLVEWETEDTAELISNLPESEQAVVFRLLPRDFAADTFEYLDAEAQKNLIRALLREEVAELLNEMAPDDRTALLEDLPGTVVKELLALLSPAERQVARELLGYPPGSIGRLMTPDYISVRPEWSVSEVLGHVRRVGRDSETLDVLNVVDHKGKLLDDLHIHDILLAEPEQTVRDLMDEHVVSLFVNDSQEETVGVFRKYDRFVLPVTDAQGILLGIVTADDVLDVAEEEATEDIQKFGGMEALDEPYLRIPLFDMVKKRAGWLVVLFLGEMLTASALGFFEEELQRAVVLALFLPLIISSGGNTGSQAATLIIRAMALGEVTLGDWWRVMRRELVSGLLLGCILGSFGFLRITAWSLFSDVYGAHWLLVAFTVGFSLIGVVLWGTLSGSMLPFILRMMGFDPATSSAPFVATLVDVTGIIIYFSVSYLVLSGTLL